ncbi:MAG: transposase [Actinomycetales bacterium]
MAFNFVAEDGDRVFLLPPTLSEWLPEDHLAYFILDAVEEIDLSEFYAGYRSDGWGGAARHPKTMVAVLLYAYCAGVVSSRKIEQACHVDVAFRVVCGNVAPDHTTIARFRARHEKALKSLFTVSLRLCAKAGMTSVGLVAVDGTKMAAPAALEANRAKESLDQAVQELFAQADAAEDAAHGTDGGDETPAALRGRADRKRRFKAAEEKLDAELAAEQAAHAEHLARRVAERNGEGRSCGAANRKRPRTRPAPSSARSTPPIPTQR